MYTPKQLQARLTPEQWEQFRELQQDNTVATALLAIQKGTNVVVLIAASFAVGFGRGLACGKGLDFTQKLDKDAE